MTSNISTFIAHGSAKAIYAIKAFSDEVFCTAYKWGTNSNLRNEVKTSQQIRKQLQAIGGNTQHLAIDYRESNIQVNNKYTIRCPKADSNLDKVIQDSSVSLFQRIKFCFQAACATHAMHSVNYLHRDLKPDNYLTFHGNTHLKLSDFGTATNQAHGLSLDGNARYFAPEGVMSEKAEVYSLGLVMIRILEEGMLQASNRKMLIEPVHKNLCSYTIRPDRGVIQYLMDAAGTDVRSKTIVDLSRRLWSWFKSLFGIKTINQDNQMALHAYIDKLHEELKAKEGYFSSGQADRLCTLFKEMTYANPAYRISAQEAMDRLSAEIGLISRAKALTDTTLALPWKVYNWLFPTTA